MLNRVCIMGQLTDDVTLNMVGADRDILVGSFRIAVDRDYKNKKTRERQADFIDVTAWRGLAEFIANYFHKGDLIILDGRLELRRWTDKEDKKRQKVGIKAENAYFGGKKYQPEGEEGELPDDLPPLPEDDEEVDPPPEDNLPS